MALRLDAPKTIAQKITRAGIHGDLDADGNVILGFKAPGYDVIMFSEDELVAMQGMLREPVNPEPTPFEAMQQTAHYDSDGNLSFQLSLAPRSRSVVLTPDDRAVLANWLELKLLQVPDFKEQLSKRAAMAALTADDNDND